MRGFFPALDLLWTRRSVLFLTVKSDIKAKYAGSALGLFWLVLYPVIFLGLYSFIYLFVFRIRLEIYTSYEYIVLIFCGLVPFLSFSEALASGVTSVTANSSLVRNTLFPVELLPVKAVFVSQSMQIVGSVLLFAALFLVGKLTVWILLFPIVWTAQILFTIGLIWMFAAFNVFLRDLQAIVSVLILMLMLISPIAYTIDMVPENLRHMLAFNPLYYIIITYQEILVGGRYPANHIFESLLVMSFVTFAVGYWLFMRLKRVFADNV